MRVLAMVVLAVACSEDFTAFEERCVDRYFEVGAACEDFEAEF